MTNRIKVYRRIRGELCDVENTRDEVDVYRKLEKDEWMC